MNFVNRSRWAAAPIGASVRSIVHAIEQTMPRPRTEHLLQRVRELEAGACEAAIQGSLRGSRLRGFLRERGDQACSLDPPERLKGCNWRGEGGTAPPPTSGRQQAPAAIARHRAPGGSTGRIGS